MLPYIGCSSSLTVYIRFNLAALPNVMWVFLFKNTVCKAPDSSGGALDELSFIVLMGIESCGIMFFLRRTSNSSGAKN